MKKLIKFINRMTNFCFYFGAIMLCFTVVMIISEIILRRFFNSSLYVTDEYTGYFLCGIASLGMAFTLREKGHIRMTVLYEFLSVRKKLIVDKIIDLVGLIFFVYLALVTGNLFLKSLFGGVRAMSVSETYIAIPQIFMPLGFLVMAFQFLEQFYYDFNN